MNDEITIEKRPAFDYVDGISWDEVRTRLGNVMDEWQYSPERKAYVLQRLDKLDPANGMFDGGDGGLDRFRSRVLVALGDAFGEIFDHAGEAWNLAPDRQAYIVLRLDELDMSERYFVSDRVGPGAVRGAGFFDLVAAFTDVHLRVGL